ncbi:MAG: transcription antitermination factor NusB [Oscillospiraceae bacterium]|jgi:N utilization substance protein B|nr:transcription antitermination factor NusB [Oscillospiraceae bacterium]
MTRSEEREQAFVLLFESSFYQEPDLEEMVQNAMLGRELELGAFARRLAEGGLAHREELDIYIEKYLRNWSKKRLSRVSLAVLRLALFEILWETDVPESVSINEAVELCKKYAGKEDASFVNGVLGSFVREREKDGE